MPIDELPRALLGTEAFLLGCSLGSFASTVAYRLPLGISLLRPRSFCPSCHQPIPWYYNIPVLGYLSLRGRCASCRSKIPVNYLIAEVVLGVIAWHLVLNFPLVDALARLSLVTLLMMISLIDLKCRIVPDALSLPGMAAGLLYASLFAPEFGIKDSLLGALVGGGSLFAVAAVYRALRRREGLGLGDVKLVAMIGSYLGVSGVFFTIFFGSLLGSLCGIVLALVPASVDRNGILSSASTFTEGDSEAPRSLLTTSIPFAPFLSIAATWYATFQPSLLWRF